MRVAGESLHGAALMEDFGSAESETKSTVSYFPSKLLRRQGTVKNRLLYLT